MDITDRLILVPLLAYQAGIGPTQLVAMLFRPVRSGDPERLPGRPARRPQVCPLICGQHHVGAGVGIEQGQVDEGARVVAQRAIDEHETLHLASPRLLRNWRKKSNDAAGLVPLPLKRRQQLLDGNRTIDPGPDGRILGLGDCSPNGTLDVDGHLSGDAVTAPVVHVTGGRLAVDSTHQLRLAAADEDGAVQRCHE
ncbi:hypothetical protein [Pseudoxanthomonas winnipegensis]|uniref:Uncharacterized protein n=1 Tax=Pseudoxanthomonas winnipegensis TaxID=2480810 RepID=A0A4Q8M6H7_9GAMM|nr:hypothetical protein [Pseudoxanthomonas winnipegensis]TAA45665.1 hypothetical protein EA655_05630 [Pseudoxanthomonas winnipegensis]